LLLIYFIAPRARKFAQFTIPDLLEARYNQTARVLGVIAILFAYTAITSYQLIGGGDILHLIFPDLITADLGKYIIAAFVIVFTAIAGMASVAYMDVVIGSLATVTLLVALPFVLHAAGGWGAVAHALPATHFQVLGDFNLAQAFELFLPTMLLMMGNQSMYQKFFSAKSEKDARHAVVGWIIGTVILETVIVALAVFGSVLFPSGEVQQRPREIIAFTALHGGPAWLGALLMGAVFAKIISTANNYLFSPSTNLVNDVFSRYIAPEASNKRVLIVSRLVVVMLGIWALYQALNTSSVLAKTLYAYTIYSAALTPVILAAFYSRRVNAQGAVSAIAAGTLVTFFWDFEVVKRSLPPVLAQRDAIFPALIAALLCLVVVSALTPPPKAEQVSLFFP
jgi:SSS family solute:Na+ symporter/sodium/proline symporter